MSVDIIFNDLMLLDPYLIKSHESVIYESLKISNEFIDVIFMKNNKIIDPVIYKCIIIDKTTKKLQRKCCTKPEYSIDCFEKYYIKFDNEIHEMKGTYCDIDSNDDMIFEAIHFYDPHINKYNLKTLNKHKINSIIEL